MTYIMAYEFTQFYINNLENLIPYMFSSNISHLTFLA